jgi:hypothetical protein
VSERIFKHYPPDYACSLDFVACSLDFVACTHKTEHKTEKRDRFAQAICHLWYPSVGCLIILFSSAARFLVLRETFVLLECYARVSTAINGDINGKNAVPTRPSAATATAPNSKNNNIFFHLLSFSFICCRYVYRRTSYSGASL